MSQTLNLLKEIYFKNDDLKFDFNLIKPTASFKKKEFVNIIKKFLDDFLSFFCSNSRNKGMQNISTLLNFIKLEKK